jgi:hypothetical protein
MSWTEKEISIGTIAVGAYHRDIIDLSGEDFEVREVKSSCNCLAAIVNKNKVDYQITGQPFPDHLDYKDSYNTKSELVLFTTKGRKIITIKYKMIK